METREENNIKYSEIISLYQSVSKDTRRELTALSLAIIGAIYIFKAKDLNFFLWLALILCFITMVAELISSYLKSEHYKNIIDKVIDGEIRPPFTYASINLSETSFGEWAEKLFYLPLITFIIAFILFIIGFLIKPV